MIVDACAPHVLAVLGEVVGIGLEGVHLGPGQALTGGHGIFRRERPELQHHRRFDDPGQLDEQGAQPGVRLLEPRLAGQVEQRRRAQHLEIVASGQKVEVHAGRPIRVALPT